VLAHKVHLHGLIGLGGHFHALIDQGHLVDEQVAEHAAAVDYHVDARAAQFFQ